MSGYRDNAKREEKATMAAEERYWTRVKKWAFILAPFITMVFVVGAICYRFATAPRPVSPPKPKCVDSAKIIGAGSGNTESECDEGARLDTTRIRVGDNTQVLVRCTCLDHAPGVDDGGQP